MRAHIFQHLAFEGPGTIQPWLKNAGYDLTFTVFAEKVFFPEINSVDFLVVMGGSMSVNDEGKFPWLIAEKQFIREFIATGKPVLGICLGAQLIASALGARVYPNKTKEIGWFSVTGLPSRLPNFQFPVSFTPLHWHGDTFDLPEGAVLLASSEATKNQAFQYGKNVLAIQFHPEADRQTLQDFCFYFKKELVPERFIQSEEEIVKYADEYLSSMDDLIDRLMLYLVGDE
ncbi:MAG: gamma-glutamyl-gamma-aminobutyrate hydrolase family protein [Bacteroidales bacterium]|jgi:GMP synthase-like glutamine amidotransferase|nr:gamma-glutamyl-gamma-aminobutyrate hydrolase family protein [Bacteroidales bacterium]